MRDLVDASATRVTLLHVHNPPAYEDDDAVDIEALHSEDRERMQVMADTLRESGVKDVEIVVTPGAPAVSAVRIAEANDVSLIAMATQGRGEIEELVVGSVALKVARTSPVAVLMIPRPR
jgi:nucleotide-binding universal stress UspA family protein